ncbi:MAG: cobalt-precorrin-5B (C(1))-methyltransferase CbiD [Paramuribaculum sp.]|nr:cobalt-precorrin-5B (C(1))-methyltransferase CbiD [Paramuribaculum sp.]
MILILGGTTEGRQAVETLDSGVGRYFYSTRDSFQKVECHNGIHLCGAMDVDEMTRFCRQNDIKLIVDAAHPFARNLHATVAETSRNVGIPVIRFERRYPYANDDDLIWCDSYNDAVDKMLAHDVRGLVALTGVQTIGMLERFWSKRQCRFRILDRDDSRTKAQDVGFPAENLFYYKEGSDVPDFKGFDADAIITKDSGLSGGVAQKLALARSKGWKIFIVRRPEISSDFITVDGVDGLRMEIERLLPGFYSLTTGFTTGSCATAAAKAAIMAIITGFRGPTVNFSLPSGETMKMNVEIDFVDSNCAKAHVIKHAGDDPDITNGVKVSAIVKLKDSGVKERQTVTDGITFVAGEGVGVVTLPGLGLQPGDAAINPVPRTMIASEIRKIYAGDAEVVIEVEGGRELAEKTFNRRLGIVGGISIIGTSGIVRPFSHEAFVESMKREIEVAQALGCRHIIVNSGAKSEAFVKRFYPKVEPQAFIHYGNAVGDIMMLAQELKVEMLTVVLMIGKAVKLADGNLDTHSRIASVNVAFIREVAMRSGVDSDVISRIGDNMPARQLFDIMPPEQYPDFYHHILALCYNHCSRIYTVGLLNMLLVTDKGDIAAQITSN